MPTEIERFVDAESSPYQRAAPWAEAVLVPAGAATLYLAGQTGAVVDAGAPRTSRAAFGDTRAQTFGALEAVRRQLEARGFGMGDIVKMQVFMVPDPELGGVVDLEGFGEAYRAFFGDGRPLPARSRVVVAGLVNPGLLVEIDVVAARV